MKTTKILPIALSSIALTSMISTEAFAKQDNGNHYGQRIHKSSEANLVFKEIKGLQKFYKHYKVVDQTTDDLGITHYTLQPNANGKFAVDKEVKVHVDKDGKVLLVTGDTKGKDITPTNTVSISELTAVSNALDSLGLTEKTAVNIGGKVVKSKDLIIDAKTNKQVYRIEIITTSPKINHAVVDVDAQTGHVVNTQNKIKHTATTGLGQGVLGAYKSININQLSTTSFELKDYASPINYFTYGYNETTKTFSPVKDTDKTFNAADQTPAVDAHYYAKRVFDYYKNTHGRNSYDNLGSKIVSVVHVNTLNTTNDNRNNAAWIGDKVIYGDGDNSTFLAPSGALDVVAHELTHAVTEKSVNFTYQGQSGALDESTSDTFAYFLDPSDYLIAEDVYTPNIAGDGLRSLQDPTKYGQPDNMANYVNTAADYGGVHANSGIPNKAAYNTIIALGKAKAEKIYYRGITTYLTSNATFLDAKKAYVQAATDLYGAADAALVSQAWDAVGVK